ncbi:MAG: hypothetical protein EZS28_007941 [Streblomastix strix]|uniref:Uncharacterized protein n=1 Tax=Streblomastix strix TaxID=222440 RepID=A0A5J4WQ63_9EUKA|nr:MAG: hypothetical protein EZS28_007941 [Streblomastix strix]
MINRHYKLEVAVDIVQIDTVSGAGAEQDDEIFYRLRHISRFLRDIHQGKYISWLPQFPPQHLLAHRSDEQIEEEGGNEEIDSQLINKENRGNINDEVKKAQGRILNRFIEQGNPGPWCHPIDSTAWEMEQGITSQSIQFTYSINKGEVVVYKMCIFQVSFELADTVQVIREDVNRNFNLNLVIHLYCINQILTEKLFGLTLSVINHMNLKSYFNILKMSVVKRRKFDLPNKGAICLSFELKSRPFCIIARHLTSG